MTISCKGLSQEALNQTIRQSAEKQLSLVDVLGQRYLASGLAGMALTLEGTPGNALGAYLDGSTVVVHGNAQDATGDTMNDGLIEIHGSSGDATGYAMRGGAIYVQGNAGYRAGIHMKAYQDKAPALIIGGRAGCFLGEYQAGGLIVVLGLGSAGCPVGAFCGAGMHGGRIFLRGGELPADLPEQVAARRATPQDLSSIQPYLAHFCAAFGGSPEELTAPGFWVLQPNSRNPYQQLYTPN
jgi:glutamate synthase domain-containing protein 3